MPLESWLLCCGCVTTGIEAMTGSAETRDWTRWLNTALLCCAGVAFLVAPNEWSALAAMSQLLLTVTSWLWIVEMPLLGFVPYPALSVLASSLLSSHCTEGLALAVRPGDCDLYAIVVAFAVSVATAAVLALWSSREDHGTIQDVLGPVLSTKTVPVFAIVNAAVEEFEFRCLLMTTLLGPSPTARLSAGVVALQAVLFAIQHVKGGFPSGASGGVLVFVWAVVLGVLRIVDDGTLLVYLIHIVADATIGVLILRRGARRRPRRSTAGRSHSPSFAIFG